MNELLLHRSTVMLPKAARLCFARHLRLKFGMLHVSAHVSELGGRPRTCLAVTFPIVRDMERAAHGEYRLKDEILAAHAEISAEGLSRFRDMVSR